MIQFDLPLPPSTNGLFKNNRRRGRVKTPRYEAWIEEAGWKLIIQRPPRSIGPVEIKYEIGSKARGDIANYEKATTDLLVRHQIIEGDGPTIVKGLTLSQSVAVEGVRVTIKPAEAQAA